jgi:hypothetical protein
MPRPEDRNATQDFELFEGGATLHQLHLWIEWLVKVEEAPEDAHPQFKLNENGEVEGAVCVKRRMPAGAAPVRPYRPPRHARHARPATYHQDEHDWNRREGP